MDSPRPPLTRDRVLDAAMELVDASGLRALTMRTLGERLGVEAMSLYHHVARKQDLLEGLADRVSAEFPLPCPDVPWKQALRDSMIAAYRVLLRRPWAIELLIGPGRLGPARMRFYDALLGTLRGAGFSVPDARSGFLALDGHLLGFTMQQVAFPEDPAERGVMAEVFLAEIPASCPHLAEMARDLLATRDLDFHFTFGLDLVLDGLERALHEETGWNHDSP